MTAPGTHVSHSLQSSSVSTGHSSHTEISLQQPTAPIRSDGDEGHDNLLEGVLLKDDFPHILVMAACVEESGAEPPQGGEEGEDDEVIEAEEGEELVGDVPLTGGLGEVPAACDEGAEEAGQAVVGQGGDGGRQDGLEDGPCGRLGAQVVLECGPHQAEVGKVGEEDGDEDVGHDPGDGQQADPAVVDISPPPALLFRKVEVGPDQIALLGRQFDGHVANPAAVLVSHLLCFRDGGEGDESVGFGWELVPPATSF